MNQVLTENEKKFGVNENESEARSDREDDPWAADYNKTPVSYLELVAHLFCLPLSPREIALLPHLT